MYRTIIATRRHVGLCNEARNRDRNDDDEEEDDDGVPGFIACAALVGDDDDVIVLCIIDVSFRFLLLVVRVGVVDDLRTPPAARTPSFLK